MVIRTIDTNMIRHRPSPESLGSVNKLIPSRRIAHSPQDPSDQRDRIGIDRKLHLAEQTQRNELASLDRLQCDAKLLTGNLDHDIAILNIVA